MLRDDIGRIDVDSLWATCVTIGGDDTVLSTGGSLNRARSL